LSVKVGISQVLIDVALGPEPKRIIQTALSKATERPLKFKMVSGGTQVAAKPSAPRPANGAGARSRAQADPVVQRMQEKFGAEIRTVIDQKERIRGAEKLWADSICRRCWRRRDSRRKSCRKRCSRSPSRRRQAAAASPCG